MSREKTAARIKARLGDMPSWPTAAELAAELHLSAGTVRSYLHDLVVEGTVERRKDGSMRTRSGDFTSRYHVREVPLGPVEPTSDELCKACAERDYGDVKRYHAAHVPDASREPNDDLDDEAYDRFLAEATCDRCGRRRYL